MIPFSPPHIDDDIVNEVVAALKSGWITTGPRTKLFEQKLAEYCGVEKVLCVNSASAGLELMLRWFGVGPGDEVIIPAYTYTATAAVVVHCGATPVMVDVNPDFLISVDNIRKALSPKTKVIIPVDIAGLPCDYDAIMALVQDDEVKRNFRPSNVLQEKMGRPLVLSDAAHSLGAWYKGKRTGAVADITVFSFHAVKNLTTAEGGAICLALPNTFDAQEIYKQLCTFSLHGQSKDALAKTQIGNWRYDVYECGYKCNMTDVAAAMGLVELARYDSMVLKRRKEIFDAYTQAFESDARFQLPEYETTDKTSSYHVYALRVNGVTEDQRDAIMQRIFEQEVSVNVHFIPLPMLTAYKKMGYDIADYPVTYDNYSREISLPVYFNLTDEQVQQVIEAVKNGCNG
jgi:dTDP-4-amino-4,6-dideoxygalactose transaminase